MPNDVTHAIASEVGKLVKVAAGEPAQESAVNVEASEPPPNQELAEGREATPLTENERRGLTRTLNKWREQAIEAQAKLAEIDRIKNPDDLAERITEAVTDADNRE